MIMYLVQGFDPSTWRCFIPDPALFRTKEEAAEWCRIHSEALGCAYCYREVSVGRMEEKGK